MARTKEFDRQTVLGEAMEVFWTRGYEATSMTFLRLAMGLSRQSLYDTFGDKKQLFAEALARYVNFNDGQVAALLENEDALEGIRSFLQARVRMLSADQRRGCLMINTCVELSLHDDEVASQISSGMAAMQAGFETALKSAKRKGQISKKKDVSELAVFLTSQVAGMAVMAKNKASKKQLQAIADQTMKATC